VLGTAPLTANTNCDDTCLVANRSQVQM